MPSITTAAGYHLDDPDGGLDGLTLRETQVSAPRPTEVVIKIRAASLNRRDLMILDRAYPLPAAAGVVPLSDEAGEVVAVGDAVSRTQVGDRVAVTYFRRWIDGPMNLAVAGEQTGCAYDGMLAEYQGIGRAAAGQLAALGITVLIGARDPRCGEEAAAALRGAGGDAHAVTLDVTDPTTIQEAANQAKERFGHLDVLINNAGSLIHGPAAARASICPRASALTRLGAASIARTLTSASIAPMTAVYGQNPDSGLRYRKPDIKTTDPSGASSGSAALMQRYCPQSLGSKKPRTSTLVPSRTWTSPLAERAQSELVCLGQGCARMAV